MDARYRNAGLFSEETGVNLVGATGIEPVTPPV